MSAGEGTCLCSETVRPGGFRSNESVGAVACLGTSRAVDGCVPLVRPSPTTVGGVRATVTIGSALDRAPEARCPAPTWAGGITRCGLAGPSDVGEASDERAAGRSDGDAGGATGGGGIAAGAGAAAGVGVATGAGAGVVGTGGVGVGTGAGAGAGAGTGAGAGAGTGTGAGTGAGVGSGAGAARGGRNRSGSR